MNAYANVSEARLVLKRYGVPDPGTADLQSALDAAARDVDRHLAASYAPGMLPAAQAEALRDATCIQCAFRLEMADLQLGVDDGIAALGPVTVSLRTPARFSVEAAERLAGLGLMRRSLTVSPLPVDPAASQS